MPTSSESGFYTCFPPDIRNLGGRRSIVDNLYAHRVKLSAVKPVIDSAQKTPRPPAKDPSWEKYKQELATIERAGGYASLSRQRARVNSNKTNNDNLATRLSRNRRAHQERRVNEHAWIISNMQRRIHDYHSATERKKNPFDVSVYPAFLMRRLSTGEPAAPSPPHTARSARSSPSRINPHRGYLTARTSTAPEFRESHSPSRGVVDNFPSRPMTTSGTGRSRPISSAASFARPRRDQLIEQFKLTVTDQIVANRVYKKPDLEKLFENAIIAHPHLDKEKMEAVIQDIRREMDADI
eukprot:CAMPEP_0114571130 /NCGR_PEP_ID=MMETSP0114-20121206/17585_1 /TAXON_ID=31324 /ORGANISM="Goniomonas sp, Strain m" /LENGTH=295 /DNA_ID=CAMNT_0001758235 /DNA_START=69 /DNA_END=956 /DNA_ORIENTATION=-